MSKQNWYIEDGVFEENSDNIRSHLGERAKFFTASITNPTPNGIGIVYASIQIARRAQREGSFCMLPDSMFDYSQYWNRFDVLNKEWIIAVPSQLRKLVKIQPLFVKEEKGYKSYFTGSPVHDPSELDGLPEDLFLVCSSTKEIGAEYRCVVYNNEVITGSIYYGSQKRTLTEAMEYANIQAQQAEFDVPIYTIDVCEYEDSFKVVEVNGLLCAGWYECDVGAIIDAVDECYESCGKLSL